MSRFGQIARELGRYIPPAAVRPLGRPAAVFFHGVERTTIDSRLQQNHHELDDFVAIAKNLKENFDVLPLAAMDEVLKDPDKHSRAVFLMSDDGYANTLTLAADLLDDLKLPWTLFLSTHHIDAGDRAPIFLARLFVYHAPPGRYAIPHLPVIDLNGDRDAAADRVVWQLRALDMEKAQQAVDNMIGRLDPNKLTALLEEFGSEKFLTWDQVRELKQRGVEIGAHAHRHWPMNAAQSAATLKIQAETPKQRIEAEVGPCRAFAYPFGNKDDVSRAAWQAVRDAGYDKAFSTMSGTLDMNANRYLLPRYGIEPQAPHLTALISLLRAGNPRVGRWQQQLAR